MRGDPFWRYEATPDRAGLAIAGGSGAGGAFAALLALLGDGSDAIGALLALFAGAAVTATVAVLLGLPIWLALRRRGPLAAALLGAVTGFLLFLAGQTGAFGLLPMAATDTQTMRYRWLSAVLTGLTLALPSAAIAALMWRIAYRRELVPRRRAERPTALGRNI